jgi:hypothetical protein
MFEDRPRRPLPFGAIRRHMGSGDESSTSGSHYSTLGVSLLVRVTGDKTQLISSGKKDFQEPVSPRACLCSQRAPHSSAVRAPGDGR